MSISELELLYLEFSIIDTDELDIDSWCTKVMRLDKKSRFKIYNSIRILMWKCHDYDTFGFNYKFEYYYLNLRGKILDSCEGQDLLCKITIFLCNKNFFKCVNFHVHKKYFSKDEILNFSKIRNFKEIGIMERVLIITNSTEFKNRLREEIFVCFNFFIFSPILLPIYILSGCDRNIIENRTQDFLSCSDSCVSLFLSLKCGKYKEDQDREINFYNFLYHNKENYKIKFVEKVKYKILRILFNKNKRLPSDIVEKIACYYDDIKYIDTKYDIFI
jgi:hypothetical protein